MSFFNDNIIGSQSGKCSLVFHVWREEGELSYESLESSAWEEDDFNYTSLEEFKKYGSKTSSESLNEYFKYGEDQDAIMEDFCKGLDVKEGEDRYFEFVADYSVINTRDYWGEYDSESEIKNDKWQEISKEEWEGFNNVSTTRY